MMRVTSLRSTTAILVVFSLLQSPAAFAQAPSGARASAAGKQAPGSGRNRQDDPRPDAVICAEAGITDDAACIAFIEALDVTGAGDDGPEAGEGAAPGQPEDPGAQGRARAEEAAAQAAAAEAQAAADTAAEAQAQAAAEAEAEARAAAEAAEAEAQAAGDAADEAQAQADAEARAAAEAAEAEAQAAEDAAAEAQAQAAAEAEARAAAEAAEAEAQAAEAQAAEDAADEAQAQAAAEARAAAQAAAAEDARASAAAQAAVASEAPAAALADSDAEPAEVTSETVTEQTRRSSSEEFVEWRRPTDPAIAGSPGSPGGLSDLERAGLLALGAVVVGAILSNGQRVEAQTGDRVVLVDDLGLYTVLKDDDALLRTPGAEVQTERFADGSTRTVVVRDDGTTIITVRDAHGRALRRVRVAPDGREYLLIDDTRVFQPVIVADLPPPIQTTFDYQPGADRDALRLALLAADRRDIGRSFSLRQVREIVEVRELAPEINLDGITFETNSAAIQPEQAESLREMGLLMRDLIRDNPGELFLVEGHTDAIGEAGYNLLLSDRRAESVALAFSEYFGVGPENIIVQGYGERFLKIPTQSAERLNRRVAVRRITALVRTL